MSIGQNTSVVVERIVAELVDLVVTFAAVVAVAVVGLLAVGGLGAVTGAATGGGNLAAGLGLVGIVLVGLVALVISVGYNVILEVAWDGQTVGKRLLGINVVETDGSAPGVVPVVIRNLPAVFAAVVGAVLVYPLILPVGLAAIFLSEEDQRVFDVFAGTFVFEA
ncbi:MAG: RDD family protein [Haloferacaceae archaeon]